MNICEAVMSQFPGTIIEQFLWPFVQTETNVDTILPVISNNPGIVMYTILPDRVEKYLYEQMDTKQNIVIPALSRIIDKFGDALNIKVSGLSGRSHSMDEHEKRITAMMYTIEHDDGQSYEDLDDADIILIGVSRTSKTPTSIYLACRGFKVANIPFISEDTMPNLKHLDKPLIIGLTIDPMRLAQLRLSRKLSHDDHHAVQLYYTNIDKIEEDILIAKRFFSKLSCHVVDITKKSVEEISATIIKIHNIRSHR